MYPDSDPAIFVNGLQDANKTKLFFIWFYAQFFVKVHLHHSSKIKSHKTGFYKLFLLEDERIRIRTSE
jgi:hypothetical protein